MMSKSLAGQGSPAAQTLVGRAQDYRLARSQANREEAGDFEKMARKADAARGAC
jgi:hypothetical protein